MIVHPPRKGDFLAKWPASFKGDTLALSRSALRLLISSITGAFNAFSSFNAPIRINGGHASMHAFVQTTSFHPSCASQPPTSRRLARRMRPILSLSLQNSSKMDAAKYFFQMQLVRCATQATVVRQSITWSCRPLIRVINRSYHSRLTSLTTYKAVAIAFL